jgi:hypothetical protein
MGGNVDIIYQTQPSYFADKETNPKTSSYFPQITEIVCDNILKCRSAVTLLLLLCPLKLQ